MTTTQTVEIQKVVLNRQYTLDLKDFDDAILDFSGEDETTTASNKSNFEIALVSKIFGFEYTQSETAITFKRYDNVSYKIMYAQGNGAGVTKKCIFGIVSAVKAKIKNTTDEYFEPKKPYMFIFAHKEAENAEDSQNVLRVHEIVSIPNSHFVDAEQDGTACGLFAGPTANTHCILGFNKVDNKDYFFLPKHSFCLEGKTQEIIDLGDEYAGKFEVANLNATSK